MDERMPIDAPLRGPRSGHELTPADFAQCMAELEELAKRAEVLYALTAELAQPLTAAEVANVVIGRIADAVGASAAVFYTATEGGELHLVAQRGLPEPLVDKRRTLQADAQLPLPDAIRTGTPLWFESHEALTSSYPNLRFDIGLLRPEDRGGVAALPLVSKATHGGIAFGFSGDHVFREAERNFLMAIAAQCVLALERARLFKAEVRARREAERLVRALERSNAELDQFAYVASHDLKAPLRGIANLTSWLEEDLGAVLNEESRHHMQLLQRRVRRMELLVDGILSYSRAGRARGQREPVDVQQLLSEVIELLSVRSPSRVEVGPDMPSLVTHRVPLQQVFMNLVSNALAHAGRERVQVHVTAEELADAYEFVVRDDGQGIAPESHERIWEIFHTLAPKDEREGSGVGLAIVKKIVESRGCRVWVRSAPGEGASFGFTWPKE